MPKGQRGTAQERLNKIVERRNARRSRYEASDAKDAAAEQKIREEIVRERVLAEQKDEVERRVQEELARENGVDTADETHPDY